MTEPLKLGRPKPYIDFGPQTTYGKNAQPLPVILFQVVRHHRGYGETHSMGLVFVADHADTEAARAHAVALCDAYASRRSYEVTYYYETVTSIPEPEGWLVATLSDARGTVIDELSGPASEVIAKASNFMLLHGVDPDESGAAADKGRIDFAPIPPLKSAFKDIGHGVKILKPR